MQFLVTASLFVGQNIQYHQTYHIAQSVFLSVFFSLLTGGNAISVL